MSRNLRTFQLANVVTILVFLLLAEVASAQVRTGTPPFGSFSGGPDIINLGNLNAHLTIPVLNKPGRGTNFKYDLNYDSSVWYPVTSGGTTTWHLLTGWTSASPATMGYATYQTTGPYHCRFFQETQWITEYYYLHDNWIYTDSLGTAHAMVGAIQDGGAPDCGPGDGAILTTNDGSGYQLSVPQEIVYNTSGVVADLNFGSQMGTFKDRNGNQITQGAGGVFTDTLGTTALTVTGSGTPSSAYVLTFTPPNTSTSSCSVTGANGVACYVISYVAYTVKSNFGCSGISEYPATVNNLVDRVTLPDGSYYQFHYESTPGYSGDVTARVSSIQLPTGGTISYTYSGGSNGITCADGGAATLTRTTQDGTWTYARSQVAGTEWQTLVTDPSSPANQTLIYFQQDSAATYPTKSFYETQRQVYQGSTSGTLLWQWFTCYNGNGSASTCATTAVSSPITQRTVTDQYGSSGLQCKHNYLYNSGGGLSEQDDYDYGSGGPGGLLRQILITYAPLGNNITAFQQTVTVKNGSGVILAQTNYNYDEPNTLSTVTPAVAQHTSVSGSRGNLTSINYPVSGLTAHFTYWDTGNIKTSQDVNSATTTYNYDSTNNNYCQMAFPTGITEAITTLTQSYTWNCAGGVQLTVKDENNQTTTTAYSDPYFWRPASVSYPDGGKILWTYNGQTSIQTRVLMNNTPQYITGTTLLDGLGRTKQSQLNSDPEGVDYTDTTYDAVGRIASVSNLYRSTGDPTYGVSSYRYDALSRPTSVTLQDGSVVSTSYPNNTVTTTDPAGKKRTMTYDSLGRLTQVNEDPSGLNYVTTYNYDALGNLTSVVQNGGRQRTFVYDAMSRLTSETNPESGTTTYRYDSDSNCASPNSSSGDLISRTDARNIRTCFLYDALHRVTQKNYSDGTPTAFFSWDGTGRWGYNQTNTNGRLGEEWTGTSCCASGGAEIFSYDAMGRVTYNDQYTVPMGYSALNYSYDLAGDMTSYTNGVGVAFTQSFDAAARPTGLTSSLVDANHPATLATVDSSVGYYPPGALRKMTFGNGLTQAISVEPRLQPCRINLNSSGSYVTDGCNDGSINGTIQDFTYAFGNWGSTNNDNITIMNAAGNQSFNRAFTYDSLNRLSTLNQSGGNATGCSSTFNLSWTYDAWGSRTDQNVTSGTCNAFHASVNSNNQLSGSPYQYDAAGNMTNDGNHRYYYDAEERLIQVDGTLGTCSTATACYLYDALGHRTVKQTGSYNLSYLHDLSGNPVTEYCNPCSWGTGWNTGHIYMNGQQIAEYYNSTTYFVHPDHLGSTRLLTGLNQAVVQAVDYLPFGELNSSNSWYTDHFFTGLERDSETNLDHTQFRQYSSQLGRWMTPDPAGLAAVNISNPQSWNRYAYVLNNPLVFVDPLGLWCSGNIGNTSDTPCNPANWDGPNGPQDPGAADFGDELGLALGQYLSSIPWYTVTNGELYLQGSYAINGAFVLGDLVDGVYSYGYNAIVVAPYFFDLGPVTGTASGRYSIFGSFGGTGSMGSSSLSQGCIASIFNPSCKPPQLPSCPAVFFSEAEGADLGLPPNVDEAAKAVGTALAIQRIVTRGLVKPLSSGYVRGALLAGDLTADFLTLGPFIAQELVGFKAEVQAWRAGTCTTIWSKP